MNAILTFVIGMAVLEFIDMSIPVEENVEESTIEATE